MVFRVVAIFLVLMSSSVQALEMADTGAEVKSKRTYPGGADEEDLRILQTLPEAPLRTDSRRIQKEVFKALYNQELRDEHTDTVEE